MGHRNYASADLGIGHDDVGGQDRAIQLCPVVVRAGVHIPILGQANMNMRNCSSHFPNISAQDFSKLNRFGGDDGYIVGPNLKQFQSEL